jgi:methionine synthase reductase
MLNHVSYLVLGLGDQNYDNFCAVGKLIDRRLREIGAIQVSPGVLADEVLGLDDFVEPWVSKVFEHLDTIKIKSEVIV